MKIFSSSCREKSSGDLTQHLAVSSGCELREEVDQDQEWEQPRKDSFRRGTG